MSVDPAKQSIRKRVWDLLEQERVVPSGVHGRIPAFDTADLAADRLSTLSAWRATEIVKAVPDKAQLPVRAKALGEGKLVYMAVPRLAENTPFYLLDPARLTRPFSDAASSATALTVGVPVGMENMLPVDLVVCGSVAVNRQGARLGKGAGYSDIEVALLSQAGLIGGDTLIATTVHELQVLDEELPESDHDFSVDVIVTPNEILECRPSRRPEGVDWSELTDAQVAAMPALSRLRAEIT